MTGPPLLDRVKTTAAKHNETGKKKNKAREAQKTLAASRPKKKASEGPRRIPKTRGVQNGTPKKRQEAGRTAKTGKNKRGGTQKQKRKQQNKCVWGCALLLPELSL